MGLYARYILLRMVHFSCGMKAVMLQRENVIPQARKRILEIGIGSGLHLPYFNPAHVEHIWGLDPSVEMWRLAKPYLKSLDFL